MSNTWPPAKPTAEMVKRLAHGGGLDAAAKHYGIPKRDWIDLSTGINPVPYPISHIPPQAYTRLPDAEAEATLIEAARSYYGVPNQATIIASPGTQALIQWLPYLTPTGRTAVMEPTYTEHAHCWRCAGHSVINAPVDGPLPGDTDNIVIVNPNNPDGNRRGPADLAAHAKADRLVVVDEAFVDTEPALSVVGQTGKPGLLVLRSFGKFFGLAGVRLGFAIGATAQLEALSEALGPWSVSGSALAIGAAAMADTEWINRTHCRLKTDAARLDMLMAPRTGPAIGGTRLFRLYNAGDTDLQSQLAERGIWTRVFSDRPSLIRLGLPADDAGFSRLAAALD